MASKPISPKAHGVLDYGFLGLTLSAPSLLDLKGAARKLSYLFGGTQGVLNALTDQPLALNTPRPVPRPRHYRTP